MTLLQVKKQIYDRLKGLFGEEFENDEELNSNIHLYIRDNLPTVKDGKYHYRKAVCEFCEQRHSN